jgi:hypothetical protein
MCTLGLYTTILQLSLLLFQTMLISCVADPFHAPSTFWITRDSKWDCSALRMHYNLTYVYSKLSILSYLTGIIPWRHVDLWGYICKINRRSVDAIYNWFWILHNIPFVSLTRPKHPQLWQYNVLQLTPRSKDLSFLFLMPPVLHVRVSVTSFSYAIAHLNNVQQLLM